ncbi:AraC family transcriptional regulator [Segetibacter koreensis]|uniref:AraC family transcriptional regulator n=1 Tax=Segetibacter koreensis TaxID=398037 RepID=UPI000368B0B1|nr:AraC family transcriptional regulator [Segetibacter koreensis]
MDQDLRKKEGFQGQKAIVIPRKILSDLVAGNNVVSTLYITDIGYYPKAQFHYRERYEGAEQHILIYCLEGKGQAFINNATYTIEAGDFFIVPIGIPHKYQADENNPWTIYWIHFKGSIANSIVTSMVQKYNGYKGFNLDNKNCIALFNEIYSQLERGYSSDHLVYSNMCLWHFIAGFIYNSNYNADSNSHFKDSIDLAIDFLRKNVNQLLTLQQISASVNLSPSHFSSIFKKKTGFTPIEYFNHLKVQQACQYLLFTSMRIKEISLELGIEDQYYFSRLFSKVMGISPIDYREKRIH